MSNPVVGSGISANELTEEITELFREIATEMKLEPGGGGGGGAAPAAEADPAMLAAAALTGVALVWAAVKFGARR